jgi:hypothetical protein
MNVTHHLYCGKLMFCSRRYALWNTCIRVVFQYGCLKGGFWENPSTWPDARHFQVDLGAQWELGALPTQVTLEEELDRTEVSKAYLHQFRKAQISNCTIRSQGGARLETLRRARWERHAGGGQAHEALATGSSFKVRRDVLRVPLSLL